MDASRLAALLNARILAVFSRFAPAIRASRPPRCDDGLSPRAASARTERARVTGDVSYKTLEMHVGAIVQGRLNHAAEPGTASVVELKRAQVV